VLHRFDARVPGLRVLAGKFIKVHDRNGFYLVGKRRFRPRLARRRRSTPLVLRGAMRSRRAKAFLFGRSHRGARQSARISLLDS